MNKVHPTAVVDPGAQVGADVEIGPYSIVGPQVVIGERTTVGSHVVLEGEVQIGARNSIGHGVIIGTPPQDLSFAAGTRSSVRMGDDNVIRELATIHRGTAEDSATSIGNKNFLMAGAHLGHNCAVGNNVIVANNCLLGGYVQVADGAFLGGGCVFHQFIRIGRLAIAQGLSAFSMDIPPFTLAAERNYVMGLNVIGLRRAGLKPEEREQIKAAFKLVYLSGHNVSQALALAEEQDWNAVATEFFDFIAAAKKRGICPYGGKQQSM